MLYEVITMRTLDFLTSQPEWDGKRILVLGESQGGGQSLAAAGLDHRVSAVVATVPAMSDFVSHFENRITSYNVCYTKLLRACRVLRVVFFCENLLFSYRLLFGCRNIDPSWANCINLNFLSETGSQGMR